jgi:shikimate dehydrogenase
MITGKSKICGLIGNPVEHSMSPAMHNAAFGSMGLDYVYIPFRVEKEALAAAINAIKALNMCGLNVTIPHKVAVIPLLDELEPLAEKIGAVNTIVNDNGRLKGYNTDAGGFLNALLERGVEPSGKKVVVIGAGGASRAISFTLAVRGAEISILNRRQEIGWAVELAAAISGYFNKEVKALELNNDNLLAALDSADILINATSVGMSPDVNQSPVASALLKAELVVFDAVYNPLKTRLLAEAENAGALTVSGIDMLVWQGALASELWTGAKAPVDIMKAYALKSLNNNED